MSTPKTKTGYSHPYMVVYHGSLPPHPSYKTLNKAVSNIQKKLEANAEWAKKYANDSLGEIVGCMDRLGRVKHLDVRAEYHDRCVVDQHSGAAIDFTLVHQP